MADQPAYLGQVETDSGSALDALFPLSSDTSDSVSGGPTFSGHDQSFPTTGGPDAGGYMQLDANAYGVLDDDGVGSSSTAFTFRAWIDEPSGGPTATQVIFNFGGGSEQLTLLAAASSGGGPQFCAYNGANTCITGSDPLAAGWHYIVATEDSTGDGAALYVDGVQVASSTSDLGSPHGSDFSAGCSTGECDVGRQTGGCCYLGENGSGIVGVAVSADYVSAYDVLQEYSAGTAATGSGGGAGTGAGVSTVDSGTDGDAGMSGFVLAEATMGVLFGMLAGWWVFRKLFSAGGWGG
ncbi:MAG: LamG-like jellyroll fold domain-containing protein [Mycobacterium sp.]|uniref:LamG-like jellyroll fold domain-containing protein n=1 Tax=Mycobacterium sp. TaxID=1785 RepID=UPI003CC661FA